MQTHRLSHWVTGRLLLRTLELSKYEYLCTKSASSVSDGPNIDKCEKQFGRLSFYSASDKKTTITKLNKKKTRFTPHIITLNGLSFGSLTFKSPWLTRWDWSLRDITRKTSSHSPITVIWRFHCKSRWHLHLTSSQKHHNEITWWLFYKSVVIFTSQ